MSKNPLNDYSLSRIARRCGQLGINYTTFVSSKHVLSRKPDAESKNRFKIQYKDGVRGTVGWGQGARPIEDKHSIPLKKSEMIKHLKS